MKKYLNHLFSLGIALLSIVSFVASSSVKEVRFDDISYINPRQNAGLKDTTVFYDVPSIKPNKQTKQTLIKGGVSVSCEVNEFLVDKAYKTDRYPTFADGNTPNLDVFETIKRPQISVSPNRITFKITVRNNQDRVLKLVDVPITLNIDAVTVAIEHDNLIKWQNSHIPRGSSKEFKVEGPQINALKNAKLVYLSIDDITTSMDKAGNALNKENFEWYFECALETKNIIEKNEYSYETTPIETRQCDACSGKGSNETKLKCDYCAGTGKLKNKEGKITTCFNCSGNGELIKKNYCNSCSGAGLLKFPKSPSPLKSKEVNWRGWQVEIKTTPAGAATVSMVDPKTGRYNNWGASNRAYNWYGNDGSKEFPIILEYNKKKVSIVPYDNKGKQISKIEVDFSNGEPIITKGTERKISK